jgi:hypothetical protein
MEQSYYLECDSGSGDQEIPRLLCSLSWTNWIQPTSSHPNPLKSILILPFHVWREYPSGPLPLGFPAKIFLDYAFFILTCVPPLRPM